MHSYNYWDAICIEEIYHLSPLSITIKTRQFTHVVFPQSLIYIFFSKQIHRHLSKTNNLYFNFVQKKIVRGAVTDLEKKKIKKEKKKTKTMIIIKIDNLQISYLNIQPQVKGK